MDPLGRREDNSKEESITSTTSCAAQGGTNLHGPDGLLPAGREAYRANLTHPRKKSLNNERDGSLPDCNKSYIANLMRPRDYKASASSSGCVAFVIYIYIYW